MNSKLFILFIFFIIMVPTVNYFTFNNTVGDPFVAQVTVPVYILDQTHKIEGVVDFLSNANQISERNAPIWQDLTANLFETGFVGSSILLYVFGSITGIDFLSLGHSQIPFLIYSLLFGFLVVRVFKHLNIMPNKKIAVVFGLIVTAIFLDIVYNLAFNKFLSFQYHAIGWISYLLILYLFFQIFKNGFDKKKCLLILLFYASLLITHYRFPGIILFNLLIFTAFFFIIGILYKNPNFLLTAKKTAILIIICLIMMTLSQFYWYMFEVRRSNFLDFTFLFNYVHSILTFDKLNAAVQASNTFQYSYAVQWKYVNYLQAAFFISLITILAVILLQKAKSKKIKLIDTLFIWSFGSTLFMILVYFMMYKGAAGLGLYEVYFLILFSLLVLWNNSKNRKFKLYKVGKCLVIMLSIITLSNVFFGINYSLTLNPYPIQPVDEAKISYPFLNKYCNYTGKIIGSSFSVSADIYQYFAKENLEMLEVLGFRTISNEVIRYRLNGNLTIGNKLTEMNDYLLLTNFEVSNGLSSDVIGYNSYLSAQEVRLLQEFLNSKENVVYTSGEVLIFNFGT